MDELLRLVKNRKIERVESGWMDALGQEAIPWEGLLDVAEALQKAREPQILETLLWYLVTELGERGDHGAALEVACHGGALLSESDVMRREAAQLYLRVHGADGASEALVAMTLGDPSVPLAVAMRRVERLKALLAGGAYVREDPGARYGRVEEFDGQRGVITVRFERSAKHYSPHEAEALQPVGADDFRALVVFERERLGELARTDPQQLIELALATFGRLDQNRLKLYIEPLLGSSAWGKWWASLKRRLEHSARIGLTAGSRPSLFLRAEPLGREDRLRKDFDGAAPLKKLRLVTDVLAEKAEQTEERRALLVHFAAGAAALAEPGASPAIALAALAVLDRLADAVPDLPLPERPSPAQWLEGTDLVGQVLLREPDGRVMNAVLDGVRRWLPDRWRETYAAAMPRFSRAPCERAAKALAAAGAWEELRGAATAMLRGLDCSPGAVVWLWKACSTNAYPQALGELDRMACLRQILGMAAALSRADAAPQADRKQALTQIRLTLLGGDKTVLSETIAGCDTAAARSLLLLIEQSTGLNQQARDELMRLVLSHQPELRQVDKPPWDEDTIYTTAAGVDKRKQRLDYVVHTRLPEVIREIGEAASFGDLSENAEYTAALEERGRLAQEAGVIQEELARAKLITVEMASADHVTIGTSVRARNLDSGEMETFTFLGPWDADPAQGVYSYRAPLSRAFMGGKIGQEVRFEAPGRARRWEVVEVLSAV